VDDGKSQPGALTDGLGGEERIEDALHSRKEIAVAGFIVTNRTAMPVSCGIRKAHPNNTATETAIEKAAAMKASTSKRS